MKKLTIIILCLTSITIIAQSIPEKVDKFMYDSSGTKPIDTIYFSNYRYVFKVKSDTLLTRWELINKKKLYPDHWKTAGLAYFFTTWAGAFFVVPSLDLAKDKYYHAGAGIITGLACNAITCHYTKNKLLGLSAGVIAPWLIGTGKEGFDKLKGGTFSIPDILATGIPGSYASIGVTIIIGNNNKPNKLPHR